MQQYVFLNFTSELTVFLSKQVTSVGHCKFQCFIWHVRQTIVVSAYASNTSVVVVGRELTINAFPPGQVDDIAERKQGM